GMVFEWTSTKAEWNPGKYIVKGGSWDDFPGVTRSAARHGRPPHLKHILVGFRCAGAVSPEGGEDPSPGAPPPRPGSER
ncbi:MAG: SUMF1/EgtB/PvdO family nonheme iron enzyme, partial [Nitrospinota bacterium]